jgi:O-antigen ligase
MARPVSPHHPLHLAKQILASPRLTSALATTSVGIAVLAFTVRQLSGWAGLIGALGGLVVLTVLSLAAQWREIGWNGLLPISLLTFVGWACATFFWSAYHWISLGGLAYLLAFTVLGIYVSLARDTIQVVRTFGNVLRFALGLSLALEVVSGILIDTPIHLLGINGHIASLGPIQGLFNTRDQLGIVAMVALVTFGIELRTRSIQRWVGWTSIALAVIMLLLTQAPLAFGAAIILGVATLALLGIRRASPEARRFWQFGVLLLAAVAAVFGWIFRSPIVTGFNATGDLTYRLRVWQYVFALVQQRELQGWGWVGTWPSNFSPFQSFPYLSTRIPDSALNAYLDVWFQLGVIGFGLFLGFLGLTFVRSWLLASRRRSVVFAWPALVLIVLLVGALAESSILIEFGWLTLVVCSVKAARELSWRRAFDTAPVAEEPAP